MAIDPIAVTGGTATKMPANAEVSAQSNVVNGGAESSQSSVAVGSTNSIDIFSYTNQQSRTAVPLDALSAEGKALHYANPTTLGEEVLNYMEGFHERVVNVKPLSERLGATTSGQSTSGQWVDTTSSGPASMMPASSSSTGTGAMESTEDRFALVLDVMEEAGFRHTETNLVSNVGQQFSRAMSTLMRGQ